MSERMDIDGVPPDQRLRLGGLDAAPGVYLMKLNQGTALEQLRHCVQSQSGTPTITFHKESITITIPGPGGKSQDNQFRSAPETLPNLLVQHNPTGWQSSGFIIQKLYPKDWGKPSAAMLAEQEETTIINAISQTPSREEHTPAKKTKTKAKRAETGTRPAGKKPAKSTASAGKSTPKHATSYSHVDSDDSSSSEDEDDSDGEEEPVGRPIPGKRPASHASRSTSSTSPTPPANIPGKRPSTTRLKDLPALPPASKKPRSIVPVPVAPPADASSGDEDDDVHASPPSKPPSQASKRPRSYVTTNPTKESDVDEDAEEETEELELHSIENITLSPSDFPEVPKEIANFDDFENTYRAFKKAWPVYIKIHTELMKNRSDFETLKQTLDENQSDHSKTTILNKQLQTLFNDRHPIVNPMRILYLKLHNTMNTLRRQLEAFSSSNGNNSMN